MSQALEDLKQCAIEYAQASNAYQDAVANGGRGLSIVSQQLDSAQQYLLGAAMSFGNEEAQK